VNLILRLVPERIPHFILRREMEKLFLLTAAAFGTDVPSAKDASREGLLGEYARFTKAAVEGAAARGEDLERLRERLFQRAFAYGERWRKRFRPSGANDVMKAAKVLYRAIGIEFHGTARGDVEIRACFFSRYYDPGTCRTISGLDAGLMAGLSGGGGFVFSRRITEGHASCRARLAWKEDRA
jgi:hypothetical protein